MLKHTLYHRTGATAIAAALALTSTNAFAQDASPAPVADAPAATAAPADAAPATSDVPEVKILSATPVNSGSAKAAKSSVKATAKSAANSAPKMAAPVAKSVAAATPVAAASSAPVAAPAATSTPVAPPAPMGTQPAPVAQTAPAQASNVDTAEIAFGGALALIALGGAAFAMRRRRSNDEEVYLDETSEPIVASELVVVAEPVRNESAAWTTPAGYSTGRSTITATPVDRSAFSWGRPAEPERATQSDKLSMTERAMQGPTPDNPSLSLKRRLKRAHFFEMHEAESKSDGSPRISRFAGLPETMVENARQSTPVKFGEPIFEPA